MQKYYFTFGSNHVAPKGTEKEGKSLFRYYVEVKAQDRETARGLMFARYQAKWSFCYSEEEFEGQIQQYCLQKYEEITQVSKASI